MRFAWLVCLCVSSLLLAGSADQEINVNTRYTVESVELSGQDKAAISTGLRSELTHLIGEKLNPTALDDLAVRIRRELHVHEVSHRVLRGVNPNHVRVVFDVKRPAAKFEVSAPKLLYQSQEGFTGKLEGTALIGAQAFTIGAVSDGDELAERYEGIVARYEDRALATDRVRFSFEFDSFHEQWSPEAQDSAALYRTREDLEPLVTFVLSRPLTVTVGASFERIQPELPAARTESANAMVTTLRYHHRVEGSGALQQEWDAGYSLRAAATSFGSDFSYARHRAEVHYLCSWGQNTIADDFTLGLITGNAPLFERFVLGNSTMLRGWNKFELDPLGGNRVVHNSVEYRYGFFQIFYDSGAIWDQGQTAVLRHSLGVGLRRNGLNAALAFPLREGHIEPVFMVGMNY